MVKRGKYPTARKIISLLLALLISLPSILSGLPGNAAASDLYPKDQNYLKLSSEKNDSGGQTWTLTVNRGQTALAESVLDVIIPSDYAAVQSIRLLKEDGSKLTLPVLTSQSEYQSTIADYHAYLAAVAQYKQELTAYEQALADYEHNLAVYNQALSQDIGEEEAANLPEEPVMTLDAPVAPEKPVSQANEGDASLWKTVLHSQEDKDNYRILLPKTDGSYSIEYETKDAVAQHPAYKVTTYLQITDGSDTVYMAEQEVASTQTAPANTTGQAPATPDPVAPISGGTSSGEAGGGNPADNGGLTMTETDGTGLQDASGLTITETDGLRTPVSDGTSIQEVLKDLLPLTLEPALLASGNPAGSTDTVSAEGTGAKTDGTVDPLAAETNESEPDPNEALTILGLPPIGSYQVEGVVGDESGDPGIVYYEEGSLSSIITEATTERFIALSGSPIPAPGFTSPTSPGQVTIGKWAKPVSGLVNTWDVTLRIEGMDTSCKSDIVLVLDRSYSMTGSKLTAAKAAAVNFVNTLLVSGGTTRIALVHYGSNVTVYNSGSPFIDYAGKGALITYINNIQTSSSYPYTNTQGALHQANLLLDAVIATDPCYYKNVVLLSDGRPTISQQIGSWSGGTFTQNPDPYMADTPYDTTTSYGTIHNYYKTDIAKLVESAYNYSQTVPYTNDDVYQFDSHTINNPYPTPDVVNHHMYSHFNSTIAEAGFFKNDTTGGGIRTLWTIGFELAGDSEAQALLQNCASPGKFYTATEANINTILAEIAGSINSAVKDATVTDPMAIGFEVPNVASISTTKGTATYNSATKTISWNIGTISDPISPGSNIKYAQLTYRVAITDAILGVTPEVIDGESLYPTNGSTSITYTDVDPNTTNPTTTLFPVPKVNPIFLKVEKVRQDADGNVITTDPADFDIRVTSNPATPPVTGYSEYNRTFTLSGGESTTFQTDLRLADGYSVAETSANAANYDITYQVKYGESGAYTDTSSFTVNPPAGSPLLDSNQNDVYVRVINKDRPPVVATKTWVGGPTVKPSVQFQLYRSSTDVPETTVGGLVTLDGTPDGVPYGTNGELTAWKYTWYGLPKNDVHGHPYTYYVKEPTVPTNYTADTVNDLTVTNTYKPSLIVKKIDDTTPLANAIFELYKSDDSELLPAELVGTQTTNSSGLATFAHLADGTYWLKETDAPDGYNLPTQPFGPFVVANGIITYKGVNLDPEAGGTGNFEVTIDNNLVVFPQSGGSGTLFYTLGGLGLMAISLLAYRRRRADGLN